jgi:hypothetical protein
VKQEILNQQPPENAVQAEPIPPKPKARKKETTAAGKIGDWQRLIAPLASNDDELKHLEVLRTRLSVMVTQAEDLKQQQAAHRAAKQESTQQIQEMLTEGARLATLLRMAVKQHYGIRSEKLSEFGLQPFRGRTRKGTPSESPNTPVDPAGL